MVRAYELLAAQCDYPLHLGVTEAGPAFQGTIKSAVAFGALLSQGIGDTIRVSLSAPPVEEVKVGNQILESLNLNSAGSRSSAAPPAAAPRSTSTRWPRRSPRAWRAWTCRCGSPSWAASSTGPGEAREADLGVASGNGKGQIFVKGEVVKTVPESQIVETLIEEAMRIAEQTGRGRAVRAARRQRQLTRGSPPCCERPPRGSSTSPTRPRCTGCWRPIRWRRASWPAGSRRRHRAGVAGGAALGLRRGGELEAVCLAGANLIPFAVPGAERAAATAFADRARRAGRRCSTIVGPAASVGAAVGAPGPALGPGPRPPPPAAPHGHRGPARRRRRAAGAPGATGRAGDPAAGGDRHVHRGGRRQPAPGRRRGRLPRPRGRAGPGRAVAGLDRRRRGAVQGRDRRGVPRRLPGAGRLGGARAPRPGHRHAPGRRPSSSTPAPRSRRSSASTSTTSTPPRGPPTGGSVSARSGSTPACLF